MKMRDMSESKDVSAASSIAAKLADAASKEFFWGCELTKDKPTITWTFEEEEDDLDYLQHTLFLRHAILGKEVKTDEKQIVQIETKNFAGDDLKQPMVSLTSGKADMCQLDLNFGHEIPVTFRLIEGSGPVFLSAQQVVEFPQEIEDDEFLTATETETEPEYSEEEEVDDEEEEEEKTKKRKAANGSAKGKKKRGKLDSDAVSNGEEDEDEEEDDEEEDMETSEDDEESDEEEEEEDEEETPKKKGKAKKGKAAPAKATKKGKAAPKAKKGSAKKGKAK